MRVQCISCETLSKKQMEKTDWQPFNLLALLSRSLASLLKLLLTCNYKVTATTHQTKARFAFMVSGDIADIQIILVSLSSGGASQLWLIRFQEESKPSDQQCSSRYSSATYQASECLKSISRRSGQSFACTWWRPAHLCWCLIKISKAKPEKCWSKNSLRR